MHVIWNILLYQKVETSHMAAYNKPLSSLSNKQTQAINI